MKDLVDFLSDNWQWISALLVILANTILLLFRRNKTFDNGILSDLIPLIIQAEMVCDSGKDRKLYVLDHYPFDAHPDLDKDKLNNYLEIILSLPTKKGGFGREKDVKKSK